QISRPAVSGESRTRRSETHRNHNTPIAIVIKLNGTPTRAYSQNVTICTRRRAPSTTIRLAIEPRIVRLPASVLDIASASQACPGFGNRGTIFVKSMTAGTLLITFERIAAVALKPDTVATPSGFNRS